MTGIFSDKQHIIFGAGLIDCYLSGILNALGFHSGLFCRLRIKNKLKSGMKSIVVLAHILLMVLRLPNLIFSRLANKILDVGPMALSSICWDVSQGKPTEVGYINANILKHPKSLDIGCPANEKSSSLITQLSTEVSLPFVQKPAVAQATLLIWVSRK